MVGYESRLELAHLILADFDRDVKRIASQPFHLVIQKAGHWRSAATGRTPFVTRCARRRRSRVACHHQRAICARLTQLRETGNDHSQISTNETGCGGCKVESDGRRPSVPDLVHGELPMASCAGFRRVVVPSGSENRRAQHYLPAPRVQLPPKKKKTVSPSQT
jgi:hypothetical protein